MELPTNLDPKQPLAFIAIYLSAFLKVLWCGRAHLVFWESSVKRDCGRYILSEQDLRRIAMQRLEL